MSVLTCPLCPHACRLKDQAVGICRARANLNGTLVSLNYGRLTSIALDPIEKKPLYHFHPGSYILSVGSFGCNLRCPFCQNHQISMADHTCSSQEVSPQSLVNLAERLTHEKPGNLGVAFTYNEPLVSYEYVLDTSRLLHERQLCAVLVSNGYLKPDYFRALLPYIDAMNLDLKGFTPEYYRYVKGDLDTVRENIRSACASCHTELTTLIVPGHNDSPEQMEEEAKFIASISPEIPLHISRFFPRYREQHLPPTDPELIEELCEVARGYLNFVYKGNC
ncbi:MAG: AmmeMemoRadiSam system radical SAM enzyme [Succinivibrio sp.]|nr:AmmeMemoRadiSam system radical SAM enzyme [Succinivibrio sp.]